MSTSSGSPKPASHVAPLALCVAVLTLVGVAIRWSTVHDVPLAEDTAASAWAASELASGHSAPTLQHPPQSALLLSAQIFGFWLLDHDAMARLPGGLAGALLLFVLPLGVGSALRLRAMTIAALLAISPSWVMATSVASSTQLAALLLLVLSGVAARGLESRQDGDLTSFHWRSPWFEASAGTITGGLLLSGPIVWDWFLIALVTFVITRWRGWTLANSGVWRVSLAATVLVVSTTGLSQWDGPLAISASLTSWLESWSFTAPLPTSVSYDTALLEIGLTLILLVTLAVQRSWHGEREVRAGLGSELPGDPPGAEYRLVVVALLSSAVLGLRPGAGLEQQLTTTLILFALVGMEVDAFASRAMQGERASGTNRSRRIVSWLVPLLAASCLLSLVTVSLAPLRTGASASPHFDLERDVQALVGDRFGTGGGYDIDVAWDTWPDPRIGWALRHALRSPESGDRATIEVQVRSDRITLSLADRTIATYHSQATHE